MSVLEGTITGTGATGDIQLWGSFDVSLRDFGSATVALQRSTDGGKNWGTVESFTADAEKIGDCSNATRFRFNCTAYTSGTIAYRLSK